MELGKMGEKAPKILYLIGPEPINRYELAAKLARWLGYKPDKIPKGRLTESGIVRPRDLTLDCSLARDILNIRIRAVGGV